MALKYQADGIAYTYNEPAIFVEFAYDCMVLAKKKGLKNIFVSNGFESKETFDYVKPYLDAINIDLKSFRADFYQQICKAKIEPIKENIKRYFQAGIETEVTTLIIPDVNDGRDELSAIAKFLLSISTDIPWHISAFYPAYKMTNTAPTPRQTLIAAYEIGKKAGLKYVYIGNIIDDRRTSTDCPKCRTVLVRRRGYKTEVVNIDRQKGRCKNCQEKIYGVWS
jgi:pyruvate formate lyase activating enzyme